jgi:DHA2 family multidrug resistance protein
MQLADTTIVNVALPTIDGALGASVDQGAWFVTAYIIANVITIPLSPWLQTLLGRKNYFALSIAGFSVVSILCGLAHDTNTEIALRFIQGAFGGGLMVPAQQIMRDTFPPSQLATSQSLFALGVIIGPTVGPTLGGILTDSLSWHWVFFINVLPGLIATILVMLFLRDPGVRKRVPFDVFGIALLASGLGCMQYVLDEGERNGWFDDSRIAIAAVASVIALGGFVAWELFGTRSPAVALRTFRHRTVWALAIIYFAVAAGIFALVFIQPQWAQTSLGFTTTLAGVLLMVRTGALVVLYPVTTWVTSQQNWDMRIVAAGGILVAGLSTWLQASVMTTQTPFIALVATQVLGGVGYAFIWVPLSVVLFKTVPGPEIPSALALTRLVQQIGASAGSAYAATLLDRGYDTALSNLAGTVTLHSVAVSSYIASHGSEAIRQLSALVAGQAANLAAADATRVFGLITILAAVLPFLLNRRVSTIPALPAASPAAQNGARTPQPANQ